MVFLLLAAICRCSKKASVFYLFHSFTWTYVIIYP